MLPSYLFLRVTHQQRSLSCFTRNTVIEMAILNLGHSYIYQPTSVFGNTVQIYLVLLCMCYHVPRH